MIKIAPVLVLKTFTVKMEVWIKYNFLYWTDQLTLTHHTDQAAAGVADHEMHQNILSWDSWQIFDPVF